MAFVVQLTPEGGSTYKKMAQLTKGCDVDHLANSSFWYKMFCMMISVEFAKSKYFFGWVLADAIHNAAGMGFNGYDDKGNPKWDAASNVNVWNFEVISSEPESAQWIVGTEAPLFSSDTCYDRVTFQPALMTFLLSSIWHGFLPWIICNISIKYIVFNVFFFFLSLFQVRANVRPLFQGSYQSSAFYDVLTWATTYVTLAYIITPFTYLRLDLSIKFFNSIYWWLHIVAIITLLVLPAHKRLTTKMNDNNKVNGAKDSSSSTLTGQSGGGGVEEVKKVVNV
nr:lysophospholipid acyltransferase 2-like [Lytechinus pictus]